jgi:hypothetical protein
LAEALDVRYTHFTFHEKSLYTFIRRFEDTTGIGVCVGLPSDYTAAPDLVIDLQDSSPRQILDEVIRQRPDLTWQPLGGNLVRLLPIDEHSETRIRLDSDILNLPLGKLKLQDVTGLAFHNDCSLKLMDMTDSRIYERHSDLSISLAQGQYELEDILDAFCLAALPNLAWEQVGFSFQFISLMSLRDVETQAMTSYRKYQSDPEFDIQHGITLLTQAIRESPYARARVKAAGEIGRLIEATDPSAVANLYTYLIENDRGWKDAVYANLHTSRTHAWILSDRRIDAREAARRVYEQAAGDSNSTRGIGRYQLVLAESSAVTDIDSAEANLRELAERYPTDTSLAEMITTAIREIEVLRKN